MRRTSIVAAALPAAACLGSLIGCRATSAAEVRLDANRTLGAAVAFRNLSVMPVYDSRAAAADTYTTLDEGLKAKTVTVKESPQGGDVNKLYVSNLGKKPVYILGGEVILGGQQDRCIGKDLLLPPRAKAVPITVFCVEHGRWSGAASFTGSAKTLASQTIRLSAQDGAVAAAIPELNRTRPGGLINRNQAAGEVAGSYERISRRQTQVWAAVAQKNARFNAAPASGTYREVLEGTGGNSGASVEPYIKALAGALSADKRLVGVVTAVDGKVVAADVFGEPALFRKLWPKLLRSYASDAAEAATGKVAPARRVTAASARAFLAEAAAGANKAVDRAADTTITRLEGRKAVLYRSGASAGGSMAGKAVHENYLAK